MYDIIIIGGGVTGTSIARELSKYKLDILLLEKDNDVSCGASKANSGIIHGGYDADSKKLKGYFSRKGNQLFDDLERDLNFGFKRTGSLVLGFSNEDLKTLKKIMENGIKNGVDDLVILSREEVLEMEPNLEKEVTGALYCKSAGVASPYEYTIALAENAISNGVHILLENEVDGIEKVEDHFIVSTNSKKDKYKGKIVINASGVFGDKVSEFLLPSNFSIIPRRGEYIVFQRGYGSIVNNVIFQCPTKEGKGILVTPTFHNNLMIGPNAQEVDIDDVSNNTLDGLKFITEKAMKSLPTLDMRKAIRSFAGTRATSSTGDFIIENTSVPGFINCVGIESPGLTSSPAIAKYVVDLVKKQGMDLQLDPTFNPSRKAIIKPLTKETTLDFKEAKEYIDLPIGNPDRIVCRCEQVREKTIVDALSRGMKVTSLDGVKRRTRAGMGACQGKFCSPRVKELVGKYHNINSDEVEDLKRPSSPLITEIKKTFS